ncbi:VWA domain-containing protein, partial [Streptomyces sp. SID11385]|nr:VWA domain-containing protein [Streptomyces sp. SID11385]
MTGVGWNAAGARLALVEGPGLVGGNRLAVPAASLAEDSAGVLRDGRGGTRPVRLLPVAGLEPDLLLVPA